MNCSYLSTGCRAISGKAVVSALLALLLTAGQALGNSAAAQEAYPPTGEKLRDLADHHGFWLGYASRYDFQSMNNTETYQQIVTDQFNIATSENSVKWEYVHPQQGTYDFTDMDRLRDFANTHGMVLHGHPLLWHNQNPAWLDGLSATQVEAAMLEHINTVVSRYAGQVKVWDVVNEGLNDPQSDSDTAADISLRSTVWFNAMGPDYIRKAFEAARAADPTATLIYNEYDIGWYNAKSHAMYELVSDMVNTGVPIDGVGLQMHLNHTFIHYEDFSDNMQRYADLDLDIYLTEFDVRTLQVADYETQGEVYEGVLRRCLMQPRCRALQIWGLDDLNSWQPYFDPLPFDDYFNIKPAFYGMQRALQVMPLHVENHVDAENVSVVSGSVKPSQTGAWIRMETASFDAGFQKLGVRYKKSQPTLSMLEVRADGVQGPLLATLNLGVTGAGFSEVSTAFANFSGSRNLVLVFKGDASDVSVDWMLLEEPVNSILQGTSHTVGAGNESTGTGNDGVSVGGAADSQNGGAGVFTVNGLFLVCLLAVRRRAFFAA